MPRLVLASASPTRRRLLEAASVPFDIIPGHVDEEEIRLAMTAGGAKPREVAGALAELKAVRVSMRSGEALVLGADQLLVIEGQILSKARTSAEARLHLEALRGRRHELVTAACVAKEGAPIWRHVETARLTMRNFSDGFLDWYLDHAGDAVLGNVGCYAIEGVGAQLFDRIEGDPFVVQGLPLIAILGFLRTHGVIRP